MKSSTLTACAFALCALPKLALGYPLDAYEQTEMLRLEAYRLAQTGEVKGRLLPPGARLKSEETRLREEFAQLTQRADAMVRASRAKKKE